MKKHFIAALMVVVLCLSVFTGCSFVKAFERDLQLIFKVNGEITGVYTVNIFNSAVVSAPAEPEGKSFYGWSPQENWEELERDDVTVLPNKTYIMYNDVKDFIKGEELSLTLYATFFEIPPKDLVVAWYRAGGVSTATGLNEDNMSKFTDNMFAYLESKGYTPAEMEIVIRPYDGNVGTSCGTIKEDGDVDIMVGWASNIGTQGGMTFKENVSGVLIGEISRYAARLNDKYMTKLIFVWILNTYGGKNLPEPDPNETPEPEPEPKPEPEPSTLPTYTVDTSATFSIKLAWYAKSGTSGIEQTHVDALVEALKTDLEKMGFTIANVTITTKGYDGNVGPSCASVKADGDVDIMIGWGSTDNLTGTGKLEEGKDFLENVGGVTVGTTARYAARVTDTDFTKIVYAWIQNTYGTAVDYPACFGWAPPTKLPAPDPDTSYKLVIGWYSKSATSGLNESVMNAFKAKFEEALIAAGYDMSKVTIDIRDIGSGGVADVGKKVNDEGDYDMIFGMGANITSTAKIEVKAKDDDGSYRQDGVTMTDGTNTASRNIAIVASSTNEFAITVWNWLVGSYNNGWLYSEDAKTVGIYIAA